MKNKRVRCLWASCVFYYGKKPHSRITGYNDQLVCFENIIPCHYGHVQRYRSPAIWFIWCSNIDLLCEKFDVAIVVGFCLFCSCSAISFDFELNIKTSNTIRKVWKYGCINQCLSVSNDENMSFLVLFSFLLNKILHFLQNTYGLDFIAFAFFFDEKVVKSRSWFCYFFPSFLVCFTFNDVT